MRRNIVIFGLLSLLVVQFLGLAAAGYFIHRLATRQDLVLKPAYAKLLEAQNQWAMVVSNQTVRLSRQERVLADMQALTNLYTKLSEYEQKLSETSEDLRQKQEEWHGHQQQSLARTVSEVEVLKRGVINMSLAVQQVQYAAVPPARTEPAALEAPPAAFTQTNVVRALEPAPTASKFMDFPVH